MDRLRNNPSLDTLLVLLAEQIASNIHTEVLDDGTELTTDVHFGAYHIIGNVMRDELPGILAITTGLTVQECQRAIYAQLRKD